MSYYLFDSIRHAMIVAVIVETIMVLMWAFSQWRWRRWTLLVGPVLAGFFVLMDYSVETNREQLERLTKEVVQAVEDENADGMIALLSDNFRMDNGMNKAQTEQMITARLAKPIVLKNRVRKLIVLQDDDHLGKVEFTVITQLDPKSPYAIVPIINSQWLFGYRKKAPGQYRLFAITNKSFNNGKPIDIFTYRPGR